MLPVAGALHLAAAVLLAVLESLAIPPPNLLQVSGIEALLVTGSIGVVAPEVALPSRKGEKQKCLRHGIETDKQLNRSEPA